MIITCACLRVCLIFTILIGFYENVYAITVKMKYITLNLRYDNKSDGINSWDNRKERVFQFIEEENADVICFQEVLNRQLVDINAAQNSYSYVGVGREDGKTKGEYAPIFYKKAKYEKVKDGIFWLSEQPDSIGSIGWDAGQPRIATWAILRDKKKDREFVVINTHFDDIGINARQKSSQLLKKWIIENTDNLPVILSGDLNVTEESMSYQLLIDNESPLVDTYKVCKKQKGVDYSFHNFGRILKSQRKKIDYIFVTKDITVKSVDIPIEESVNDIFLSDHNPLISYIQLNKNSKKLF